MITITADPTLLLTPSSCSLGPAKTPPVPSTAKIVTNGQAQIKVWHSRSFFIHAEQEAELAVWDTDTDTLLYSGKIQGTKPITRQTTKSILIKFIGSEDSGTVINVWDGTVMLNFPDGALGDTIGWFGYADRFQKLHNCKVICAVPSWFIPLVKDQYPNLELVPCKEADKIETFSEIQLGLFFGGDTFRQDIDFRHVGNHTTVGHILGVDTSDVKCKFDLSAPRKIKDKYVCIAAQGSSKTKCWNNPYGWYEVIKFLKKAGYRVLCIDKYPATHCGPNANIMPPGAEDFTGDLPLQERIDLLKDADFFIGLSSGLSWLAWCCNIPVVLISGFTLPFNEFYTPYRVINYNGCTGCWNDLRENFDHSDYMWCPRHKGTDRQFECSRIISHKHVISVIKQIPGFVDSAEEGCKCADVCIPEVIEPVAVAAEAVGAETSESIDIITVSDTPAHESSPVDYQNLVYTVDCHLI